MFSRKTPALTTTVDKAKPKLANSPSVISNDTHILGNIITEGYIDIDGNIEGNIKCTEVTLRKNGIIKGDIIADTANIYGRVKGLVKAKNVFLFKSCVIEGVVLHESVAIEDGAYVDGQLKRTNRFNEENASGGDGFGGFSNGFGGNGMQGLGGTSESDIEVIDNVRLISDNVS